MLQEATEVEIEIDALKIPDELTISIEGKEIGDQLFASDLTLPDGAELISDPESLLVNVTFEQVDEELEAAAAEAEEGGAEAGADADDAGDNADAGKGDEGANS